MSKGLASIYGALLLIFLFSTILASMYLTTQMHSSIIRSEAAYAASNLRKEAELVRAFYSVGPEGLNISVRNLGSLETTIEYLVAVRNNTPIYVNRVDGVLGSGSESSFLLNIPVQFDNLYLVTGRGNFIPVVVNDVSNSGAGVIRISGNSLQVNAPNPVYRFIPPYTLLVGAGDKWYQIYMENLSVVHAGAKLVYSLDRNISFFLEEGLLFVGNRYVGMYIEGPIGLGKNYIVLSNSNMIIIHLSNTSQIVFDGAEYVGFHGGGFWFLTSSIGLVNGSFLNELFIIDDYGVRRIYLKYLFAFDVYSIKYPRLYQDTFYAIFDDGELIYTVSFSRIGVYNGSPLYSPVYIGSVGRWFNASVIRSRWDVVGDLSLGYAENLAIFDVYAMDTYFRGLPAGFVGPIAIYTWQNESSVPVDIGWNGKLVYLGVGDELGVGDIIWLKYHVFNRKALQDPYDEWFNIVIRLSSPLVKYIINVTIDGVHGSDQYSIFPVGWIITYHIKEIFPSSFEEAFSYMHRLNYTRSYTQYPYYTWFRELVGLRRASDGDVELLFINEWGDYVVRDNSTISVDLPVLRQSYQLEIMLYSHINYSRYFAILDWPREQIVAGLYIHNILFSGVGNGVNYIGPLKPRYSSTDYVHYTDYRHDLDLVIINGSGFSKYYWVGVNNSLIAVGPLEYPYILWNSYLQLVGLKWVFSPPDAGFVMGYPGVYMVVGGSYSRVDWVTDVVGDLAYELVILGDYLLIVHRVGGLEFIVYRCWEVAG